jgi:hypothetical protein
MKRACSRRTALLGLATAVLDQAYSEEHMPHIALLGDSVIDNKAYVAGPDVAEQLKTLVPRQWKVTRLAVDGSVTSGVLRQLESVPADATHLVISAGGNDALAQSGILKREARSVGEVLALLAKIQDSFRADYNRMLSAAAGRKLPTALCTVYDPRFQDPIERRLGSLALSVINDAITREVFARGLTLLDLRIMFNNDSDFANAIEPSVQGGMKLAQSIYRFTLGGDADATVIH